MLSLELKIQIHFMDVSKGGNRVGLLNYCRLQNIEKIHVSKVNY